MDRDDLPRSPPGEAAGLCWNDIDTDRHITHIWRARKAGDNGQAIIGETKNTGSDLRMLQQHYRHRIEPTINGASAVDGLLNIDPSQ